MAAERTVLVVVRTIATASWLLDILPELIGDPRVQVLFTLDEDASAFDDGVLDILRELRGKLVPWSQAGDDRGAVRTDDRWRGGVGRGSAGRRAAAVPAGGARPRGDVRWHLRPVLEAERPL
jgi:hypothetical protein